MTWKVLTTLLAVAYTADAQSCNLAECTTVDDDDNHVDDETSLLLLQKDFRREQSKISRTTSKPNILLVLADDLGVANIGFTAKHLKAKTGIDVFEAQGSFTPHTTALAEDGVILTNNYGFKSCTPSRHALISGRLPVHIGVSLAHPEDWDGGVDTMWGWDGLPPNMTLLPRYLKQAGYMAHLVGKSEFGVATTEHLAMGRGFDSYFGYLSHGNDYWNYRNDAMTDPSLGLPDPMLGGAGGAGQCDNLQHQGKTVYDDPDVFDLTDGFRGTTQSAKWKQDREYEEDLFRDKALEIIDKHDASKPLFLMYASHLTHNPLQVPDKIYDDMAQKMCNYNPGCLTQNGVCSLLNQSAVNETFSASRARTSVGTCALVERVQLLAMSAYLDSIVNDLVTALKTRNLWDNTLMIFTGDNGGGLGFQIGGSNFPYKGGKGGDWEGGYLTPTFLSGGSQAFPSSARGTVSHIRIQNSDWFTTLLDIAQVPSTYRAQVAKNESSIGLPAIDGKNIQSAVLAGLNGIDVHDEIHLSPTALLKKIGGTWYKILEGTISNSMWAGPDYPNTSCPMLGVIIDKNDSPNLRQRVLQSRFSKQVCSDIFKEKQNGNIRVCRPPNPAPIGPPPLPITCGTDAGTGCLYNLNTDPYEHDNVAQNEALIWKQLHDRLAVLNQDYFEPFRGCEGSRNKMAYCKAAIEFNNYTYGAFINVPGCGASCIHTTPKYYQDCNAGLIPDCPKQVTNHCQCLENQNDCEDDGCSWDGTACDKAAVVNQTAVPTDPCLKRENNWASLV